jgi:O-antigen/teichoic acid export membrane protein
MMNLCSLCVVLCLFCSAGAGVVVSVDGGVVAAVCGGLVGAAIGILAAFGVVWLERASTPTKGRKPPLPFALTSLLSFAAPFASSAFAVAAAQKVSQLLNHST